MTRVIRQRFALRRDTAADWTADNPVLADGEEGYETDTGRRKVGDGTTAWIGLRYNGLSPWPVGYTAPSGTLASATLTDALLWAAPVDIPGIRSATSLSVSVATAGVSGSLIRCGLYATGTDGLPDALIVDGGTQSASTTGAKEYAVGPVTVSGRVWCACVRQGTSGTNPVVRGVTGVLPGVLLASNGGGGTGYAVAGVSGALPDPWPGSPAAWNAAMPSVQVYLS